MLEMQHALEAIAAAVLRLLLVQAPQLRYVPGQFQAVLVKAHLVRIFGQHIQLLIHGRKLLGGRLSFDMISPHLCALKSLRVLDSRPVLIDFTCLGTRSLQHEHDDHEKRCNNEKPKKTSSKQCVY